jgi:hypothetical protein
MTISHGPRIPFSELCPSVVDNAAFATGSAARNTASYGIASAPDSCSLVLTFTAGGEDMRHRGSDRGTALSGSGFRSHAEGSPRMRDVGLGAELLGRMPVSR